MRKLFTWIAGGLGLVALIRALRRRDEVPEPVLAPSTALDPAEELKRTLAETREADAEAATDAQPGPPSAASLDERRRRVHERAQEAIESMREPPDGA